MSDPTTTMMRLLERFLDVSSQRHKLIVTNMANIDTPGYRTHDLDFRSELQRFAATGEADSLPVVRPVRGLLERPDGNNVSLDREGLLLAETQIQFGLGIQLMRHEFQNLLTAINEGSKG